MLHVCCFFFKVGANGSVVVNENSSAVISQTSLHIINPHIPPSDIVYTLSRPPTHGYLAIDPNHSNGKNKSLSAVLLKSCSIF
jgi:hypothetical protein